MRSSWIWWTLNPMMGVLIRGHTHTHTHTHAHTHTPREEGHVKMEVEIRVMGPTSQGTQGLPLAATRDGERFSFRSPSRNQPCCLSQFWLL